MTKIDLGLSVPALCPQGLGKPYQKEPSGSYRRKPSSLLVVSSLYLFRRRKCPSCYRGQIASLVHYALSRAASDSFMKADCAFPVKRTRNHFIFSASVSHLLTTGPPRHFRNGSVIRSKSSVRLGEKNWFRHPADYASVISSAATERNTA